MSGRTGVVAALVALLILGAALAAVIALTTPWRPLPGAGAAQPVGIEQDWTAAELARAEGYRGALRPPAYAALAVGLGAAALLGFTGLGARLVAAAAAPLGGSWWARVIVGGLAVSLLVRAASLPLDARAEAVSRSYGISTRSWAGWALDAAKGWALGAGLLIVVLLVLYGLMRRLPDWWWLPAAIGGALLVVVVSFAYPLVVEPVFNRFEPLAEGPLRVSLLELAERDGVPVEDVLVADASRRTSALNAYISGFGSTRRIVVYDTLLEGATPAEIESIVAHELGHAEERDVLSGTLLGALGAAAGACLLFLALQSAPLLRRAGVGEAADPRSLALLLAVVAVVATVTGPVQTVVSRRVEARADVHALSLTRDPGTFVAMQKRLAQVNLSDPSPPAAAFVLFATHPSTPMRMALARDWATANGVAVPPPLAPPAP